MSGVWCWHTNCRSRPPASWTAIRRQAELATAMRARAEEDAGAVLYDQVQEDALVATRRRRAATMFDQR